MRKIFYVVPIFFALCNPCVTLAAEETLSQDLNVHNEIKRDKVGNIIDMKSEDGLRIIYMGTFRPEVSATVSIDVNGNEEQDEGIFSVFMVKSDKDTPLQLDVREGFDTRTNKFSWRNDKPWGYIADIDTNGNTRDILEGFWVRVTFWHTLPLKYGESPVIGRIGFVINNNELTYKRIRPKTWTEWQKIEGKILELEVNDEETDFQLEELNQ